MQGGRVLLDKEMVVNGVETVGISRIHSHIG